MVGSTFKVLLLGDFAYGESYKTGGAEILRREGYSYSTRFLRPFVDACDKAVVNLETPLAKKSEFEGAFNDSKPYVHWADPGLAAQALVELGIDAVSLANNHTMDLGSGGLLATLAVLDEYSIGWFGAGKNRAEAESPYRIDIPAEFGSGSIQLTGVFEYRRLYDEKFDFYAKEHSPGAAYLSQEYTPITDLGDSAADTLRVAFPHWGSNYMWRSERQVNYAKQLISSGYDLVVGHGAHSLQEIDRLNDRWIIYGMGNGNFQSGGRWGKYQEENGILPFGLWTILEIYFDETGRRQLHLNMYPVYLDNRATGFQPRPVNKHDFDALLRVLVGTDSCPTGDLTSDVDDLGWHIRVPAGSWPLDS